MKAIITKYHGPTNTKPLKIIASDCDGNKVSMSYDSSVCDYEAHKKVAQALSEKMGWNRKDVRLQGGGMADGYAFVFVEK